MAAHPRPPIRSRLLPALALGIWSAACGGEGGAPNAAAPAETTADPGEPAALFTAVESAAGLDFRHVRGFTGEWYMMETLGSGCGFLDYDNDGWLDIYLVQSGPVPFDARGPKLPNQLFHNKRDGTFRDVTAASGLGDEGYGMGTCFGDVDDDGWIDVMVTNFGPNRLYRNRGDGTFEDVSREAGVRNDHPEQGKGLGGGGLKVQHRRAYHDKTWTDRLTDRLVAELLMGYGANPLGLQVTPGAVTRKEGEKVHLPVQIVVPVSRLEMIGNGTERVGNATVVLVIKDEGGNTAPPYTMPLEIRLPEAEYADSDDRLAEAVVNLILAPGRHVIGVGVRDDVGGEMSTTKLDLDITQATG